MSLVMSICVRYENKRVKAEYTPMDEEYFPTPEFLTELLQDATNQTFNFSFLLDENPIPVFKLLNLEMRTEANVQTDIRSTNLQNLFLLYHYLTFISIPVY